MLFIQIGVHARAGEIDIQANKIRYIAQTDTYIAEGKVEIVRDTKVLLADRIEYTPKEGMIHAYGHVQYRDTDGSVLYANEVHIDDNLEFESLQDFRSQSHGNLRVAASSMRKEDKKTRNFENFVYTRCARCKENPDDPPVWHVQAETAVHDLENKEYVMHNAVVRLAGWPVFFSPYFSHPDGSVERKSGFLKPTIGAKSSKTRSERYLITPFFWNIALDKNLLISPMLTTDEGKILDLQYTQALNTGTFKAKTSYGTLKLHGADSKASEVAHYEVNLALRPQTNTQLGGNLRHTSNPGYLPNNPINTSSFSTLYSSNAYWRQYGVKGDRDRLEAKMIGYKDFRTSIATDNAPNFIPQVSGQFFGNTDRLGGRFRHRFNLRHIHQDSFANTQSFHADTQYQLGMIHPYGIVGNYALQADISYFRFDSQRLGLASGHEVLFAPRAHGTLRMPFQKNFSHSVGIIEPLVSFSSTLGRVNKNSIPNQDAGILASNETLFSSSEKYSGITRKDDSTRLSLATEYTHQWDDGMLASLLVGRSFELRSTSLTETALNRFQTRDDDYIVRSRLRHLSGLYIEDRLAIDNKNNHRLNSHEIDLSWQDIFWGLSPSAQYSFHRSDTESSISGREDLKLTLEKSISKYWRLAADTQFNLAVKEEKFRKGGVRVYYEDDCLKVNFYAQADNATSKYLDKQKKYGFTLQLLL